MDIVNRLRYFMDASKLTISQFADTCGIPRPTMSQLMNGRNKRISDEVINKIHVSYPQLNILWLMFGEGTMEMNSNTQFSEPQNRTSEPFSDQEHTDNQPFQANSNGFPPFTENRPENSITPNSAFEAPQTPFDAPQTSFDSTQATLGSRPYPMLDTADLADGTSPIAGAPQPSRNAASTDNILFDDNFTNFPGTPNPSTQNVAGQATSVQNQPSTPTAAQISGASFRNTAQDITRTLGANPSSATSPSGIAKDPDGSISISPDAHKKITNIVVFYSDNSFQSFLPDL